MRLWSTVPMKPGMPGSSSQTSLTASGSGPPEALGRRQCRRHFKPSRNATIDLTSSDESVDGGINTPGLMWAGSSIQRVMFCGVLIEGLGADARPRSHVAQVGAQCSDGFGVAHGVTAGARVRGERELAPRGEVRGRDRRQVLFVGHPDVEVAGRHRDDPKAHLGVLDAAELRAFAAVHPGLAHGEPQHVVLAGNHVFLAGELRHPEAVHDVVGVEMDRRVAGRRERGSRWRSPPSCRGR